MLYSVVSIIISCSLYDDFFQQSASIPFHSISFQGCKPCARRMVWAFLSLRDRPTWILGVPRKLVEHLLIVAQSTPTNSASLSSDDKRREVLSVRWEVYACPCGSSMRGNYNRERLGQVPNRWFSMLVNYIRLQVRPKAPNQWRSLWAGSHVFSKATRALREH